MATLSTALVRRTARRSFWQNYEGYPDIMEGLVFNADSDSDQENYPWLAYAPSPSEMTGSRTRRPVPPLDYTIKNRKWENTVPISYELRRFDKLAQIAALVGELGRKARGYPNYLLSSLIYTGSSTACYDGQYFFDTDHTDPGAAYTTNQSNALGASATSPAAPTDLEFAVAMRAAQDALFGFKDGYGDPVTPSPDTVFVCVVPSGYRSVARKVASSDLLTGAVSNDLKGTFTVRHSPWLAAVATTPAFYTFNPSGVRKPFVYQVADPVTLEDDMGGDNDFNTKEVAFGSFGYYNMGYGDWRYGVRTLFS